MFQLSGDAASTRTRQRCPDHDVQGRTFTASSLSPRGVRGQHAWFCSSHAFVAGRGRVQVRAESTANKQVLRARVPTLTNWHAHKDSQYSHVRTRTTHTHTSHMLPFSLTLPPAQTQLRPRRFKSSRRTLRHRTPCRPGKVAGSKRSDHGV